MLSEGRHVPLPLDHFFFCFLPPVAAGAYRGVSISSIREVSRFRSARVRTILKDVVLVEGRRRSKRKKGGRAKRRVSGVRRILGAEISKRVTST